MRESAGPNVASVLEDTGKIMSDDLNPMAAAALADEEFKKWLAADPVNQQYFSEISAGILGGDYGKLPPELHTAARQMVANQHEQLYLRLVTEKTKALMEILQRPKETMLADERAKQCQALTTEITNVILELPEPHRSALLKLYVPMWAKLRG